MRKFIKEYRRHQTGLMITAVSLLALVVLFSLPSTSVANNQADRPPARNFLRFIEEQSEQGTPRAALETSIVTLTHRDGRSIDLVSMVHVADAPYYAQINELAKTYDAALYELVKSEGAGVPKPGEKSKSGVSFLQRMMENVLKLEYQLDAIDYTAPNFVHADLTYEQFTKLQGEKGESLFGLMLQQMMREMAKGGGESAAMEAAMMAELLAASKNQNKSLYLKRALARSFDQIERTLAGLEGTDDKDGSGEGGSVLVIERNKAALKVARQQWAKGKKKLGLLYGGAHMPDIQQRLVRDGFAVTQTKWLVAWDLTEQDMAATVPATQPGNQ